MVASHMPLLGDLAHNPGMCPEWELNWWPFVLQAVIQSTEPHQPGPEMGFLYRPGRYQKDNKEYYEQLHTHKFDSLGKMDHILTNIFPQFTQYEIENLNSPITIKEMGFIIFNSHKRSL